VATRPRGRCAIADTYTTLLRIVQMATGSNNGLWGGKGNAAFSMLEEAIAASASVSVAAGNVTLSTANNATDQARKACISFTGSPGVTRTVTAPDVSKITLMINSSDSTVLVTSGAGLQATLLRGQVAFVLTDGATNAYAFVIADLPGKGIVPQVFAAESL
jgi:hypothetical protein